MNNPVGAKTDGARVVGKSPQQLSSNFLTWYSTDSIPAEFNSSLAEDESTVSSTKSTGLRLGNVFGQEVGDSFSNKNFIIYFVKSRIIRCQL